MALIPTLTLIEKYDDNGIYQSITDFHHPFDGVIGEQLIIYFELERDTYGSEFFENGEIVYFNPSLFQPLGTGAPQTLEPNYGFQKTLNGSMIDDTFYPMIAIGFGNIEPLKNISAEICRTSGGILQFKLYLRHTFDLKGFVRGLILQNQKRLLVRGFDETTDLIAGDDLNVYGAGNYEFDIYIFVKTPDGYGGFLTDYCDISQEYRLYFYDYPDPKMPGFWYSQNWEFSVNGTILTNNQLALYEKTKCKFSIYNDAPGAERICIFGMFKTDNNSNFIDYITNYYLAYTRAIDDVGITNFDKYLCAPSLALHNVAGSEYSAEITIDETYLTANSTYRMFAIVADATKIGDQDVQIRAFISPELQANYIEGIGCQLNYSATIFDYKSKFLGNRAILCPAVRCRSEIKIDYSYDLLIDLCTENLGFVPTLNDLRQYLTNATMEIYTETTTINGLEKQLIERHEINKISGLTFNVPSNAKMDVYGSSYTDGILLWFDFYTRYETDIKVLATYYDGILQPNPTGYVDMRGKDIKIKWTIQLDYPGCQLENEFVEIYQNFHCNNFVNESILDTVFIKFDGSNETQVTAKQTPIYCIGENCCIDTELKGANLAIPENRFIAEVASVPYSILQLKEFENWNSTDLTKKQELPIISADELFDGITNIARSCINLDNLSPGQYWFFAVNYPYEFCITDSTWQATFDIGNQEFVFEPTDWPIVPNFRCAIIGTDNGWNQNSYMFIRLCNSTFTQILLGIDNFTPAAHPSYYEYKFKLVMEKTIYGAAYQATKYFTVNV